ncbi:MAG: chemotaxis protein CheX [Phycisphaerales bacterium]
MVTTVSLEDVMLEGAKEVFASMVSMPMERLADPASQNEAEMFLATITFTGDLEGCFGIACDCTCARAVAASMLCMDDSSSLGDSEIIDAIGEIANMIMGGVKTRVQHEVTNIEISIPSVVYGRQLRNRLGEGMVRIAVPIAIGQEHRGELSLVHRQRGS